MRWAFRPDASLLLLSASLLVVLAYAPASAAARPSVRPTSSGRVSDPDAKVIVKLRRGACDWKTGRVAPAALERIKRRARREGLAYVRALRPRCWHVFKAADSQQKTAAAIKALTPADPAAAVTADASGGSQGGQHLLLPFRLEDLATCTFQLITYMLSKRGIHVDTAPVHKLLCAVLS